MPQTATIESLPVAFQDRTSTERILFATFIHENRNQGLATPFTFDRAYRGPAETLPGQEARHGP